MGTDFPSFIQRFELILFFTGYPLLYTLVSALSKQRKLLPAAYAIIGTLFFSFLLWQGSRPGSFTILALRWWGVLAMLFWIPGLRRFRIGSLLHSLVFFALMVQDMVKGLSTPSGRDQVHNDMTIFSLSFLLNATIFALTFLVVYISSRTRSRSGV